MCPRKVLEIAFGILAGLSVGRPSLFSRFFTREKPVRKRYLSVVTRGGERPHSVRMHDRDCALEEAARSANEEEECFFETRAVTFRAVGC